MFIHLTSVEQLVRGFPMFFSLLQAFSFYLFGGFAKRLSLRNVLFCWRGPIRLTCSPKGGNICSAFCGFCLLFCLTIYLLERSSGYKFELIAKGIFHIPVLLHRGAKFLILLPYLLGVVHFSLISCQVLNSFCYIQGEIPNSPMV